MKRLVYSPKASAFIKTDAGIINVTDDIVRGEVHRKINQVSSASLTLRNDQRKYTKKGDPTFRPMDPITISLNRLPGFPVQVFTGFLDKTPYFQLYPGTVDLTASCTLKRLQYTYWDPALPYVNEFMAQYGWVANRATGELYNPQAAVGLANAQSNQGSGGTSGGSSTTSNAASTVDRTAGKIFFFGDSLSQGTQAAIGPILGKKWKVSGENNVGFTTAQALGLLKATQPITIQNTVVVQLGTNDFNAAAFKKAALGVMGVLGKERRVIWANVGRKDSMFPGQTTSAQINDQLSKVAEQYSNLEIFNYNALVANGTLPLESSGVHPKDFNYKPLAKQIARVIGTSASAASPTVGTSGKNVKIVLRKSDVKGEAEAALNDGSIGNLLFATLKRIGGWDPSTIYIEKLPDGSDGTVSLAAVVARLYQSMNEQIAVTEAALTAFMGDSIGDASLGDGGTTSSSSDDASTGDIKGLDKIIPTIAKIANKWNVPAEVPIAIWLIEWPGLKDSPGNAHYGWYQWDKKDGPAGSYSGAGVTKSKPNGCYDLGFATDSICEGLHNLAQRDPSLKSNTLAWAMKIQGVNGHNNPAYPKTWGSKITQAQGYLSKYKVIIGDTSTGLGTLPGSDTTATQTKVAKKKDGSSPSTGTKWAYPLSSKAKSLGGVSAHMSRPLGNWQSDNAIDLGNPPGTSWIAVEDGTISSSLGWGDSSGGGHATVYGFRLHLEGASGNTYFYQHGSDKLAAKGTKVKKGDKIGEIGDYRSNGIPSHLHFAAKPPTNPETVIGGADITSGGGDSTGSGSGTDPGTSDALATARASAFAASFNFPTAEEMMEAIGLQGDRSLLNDQPLLPFIQQLTEGSMRHFQSMPNGNFFAFFPDYFGTFGHRKAYWEIDDIEVLDGKLELNDDALVTHMYVVGDTILPNNQIDFVEKLLSRGVVTVFNAGAANWLAPKDNQSENFFGDRDTTLKFLKRYGARPQYEPSPFIRSAYYEIYVAWQKFMQAWSRQFISTFTFTFMPELYPGGIVAFPTHGIQMYIEEVHHLFDYETGFTTQANLSSPASTDSNNDITRGLLPKAAPFSNVTGHTNDDPNVAAKNALKGFADKGD